MIKFRSMRVDAEAKTGAVWAKKDDPRRTPLGAFLRKTSLDELPQLFNVLMGDMSLVGPRPERPELIEKFSKTIPNYNSRHSVKAGITGWAQVNGWRGNTSLRKRIQFDLYYITHWTPWLDVRIMWMTLWHGLVIATPIEKQNGSCQSCGSRRLWKGSFFFSFQSFPVEKADGAVLDLHLVCIRHNRHYSGLLALVFPPPDNDMFPHDKV